APQPASTPTLFPYTTLFRSPSRGQPRIGGHRLGQLSHRILSDLRLQGDRHRGARQGAIGALAGRAIGGEPIQHWGAVARSTGEVRQVDEGLSALATMERGRDPGSGRHAPCPGDGRQLPPQPGFDDGSRSCLGCRRKKGTREQALAVRGPGSPVKFIVSVMPEASGSSLTSRPAKRRTRVSEKKP